MTSDSQPSKREVLWIDGIGGFLLCFASEVTVGQPAETDGADVAIRADLSRRHATIRREGENYILTPIHEVKVGGVELTGPSLLRNGALVELGNSVLLRFTRPHSLSATAVLRVESHHNCDPAVDGIILMSESCVLGPKPHSHITCSQWEHDLVLFRRGDQLHYRTESLVEIEGLPAAASGVLAENCRIEGEDFALSLEEI